MTRDLRTLIYLLNLELREECSRTLGPGAAPGMDWNPVCNRGAAAEADAIGRAAAEAGAIGEQQLEAEANGEQQCRNRAREQQCRNRAREQQCRNRAREQQCRNRAREQQLKRTALQRAVRRQITHGRRTRWK